MQLKLALQGKLSDVMEKHYSEGAKAVTLGISAATNGLKPATSIKVYMALLRDASPDYWGRRIIERNLKVAQADEMTYLLQSADDRIGALGFGFNQTPPAPNMR